MKLTVFALMHSGEARSSIALNAVPIFNIVAVITRSYYSNSSLHSIVSGKFYPAIEENCILENSLDSVLSYERAVL